MPQSTPTHEPGDDVGAQTVPLLQRADGVIGIHPLREHVRRLVPGHHHNRPVSGGICEGMSCVHNGCNGNLLAAELDA